MINDMVKIHVFLTYFALPEMTPLSLARHLLMSSTLWLSVAPILDTPEVAHEAMYLRVVPSWSKGSSQMQYLSNPVATVENVLLGSRGVADAVTARAIPTRDGMKVYMMSFLRVGVLRCICLRGSRD